MYRASSLYRDLALPTINSDALLETTSLDHSPMWLTRNRVLHGPCGFHVHDGSRSSVVTVRADTLEIVFISTTYECNLPPLCSETTHRINDCSPQHLGSPRYCCPGPGIVFYPRERRATLVWIFVPHDLCATVSRTEPGSIGILATSREQWHTFFSRPVLAAGSMLAKRSRGRTRWQLGQLAES